MKKIEIIKNDDLLKINIGKLLFKWLIHMRQKFADNDGEFKGISENMEPFVLELYEKDLNIPMNFDRNDMGWGVRLSFDQFLKAEFLENSHLFPTFASIVRSFYDDLGQQRITCQELENKYFGDGGYNTNVILKYLITIHDPKEGLMECILNKDKHVHMLYLFLNQSIPNFLIDLESKGHLYLEIPPQKYLDMHSSEYFLKIGKRIAIKNCEEFFHLSEILNGSNLSNMDALKKIVKFKGPMASIGSNLETIKNFLDQFKIHNHEFEINIGKCNEYLKMINETGDEIKLVN